MKLTVKGSPEEIANFFKSVTIPTTGSAPAQDVDQPRTAPAPAPEQPQPEKSEKPASAEKPESRPRRSSIGFVKEGEGRPEEQSREERAPERSSEEQPSGETESKSFLPNELGLQNITDLERSIMNYLVDNEGATAQQIADSIGITRQSVSMRLAKMEALNFVRSDQSQGRLTFYTRAIQRKNQFPPPEGSRSEWIGRVIEEHPGSTNREIGCRLLLSTEDVSATTAAHKGRRWKRSGSGQPQDPIRYWPMDHQIPENTNRAGDDQQLSLIPDQTDGETG